MTPVVWAGLAIPLGAFLGALLGYLGARRVARATIEAKTIEVNANIQTKQSDSNAALAAKEIEIGADYVKQFREEVHTLQTEMRTLRESSDREIRLLKDDSEKERKARFAVEDELQKLKAETETNRRDLAASNDERRKIQQEYEENIEAYHNNELFLKEKIHRLEEENESLKRRVSELEDKGLVPLSSKLP